MLQIRNVPEETRTELKRRAAKRGESMNAYLLRLLEREVDRPTIENVFERAARRAGIDVSTADLIRAEREARDAELARRTRW
ncbi:MAG TPA: hypothetical protein VF186_00120 [Gaiellaceae bacterium]